LERRGVHTAECSCRACKFSIHVSCAPVAFHFAALEDPEGVPITAIIFGGRRAKLAPLVYESRSWQHGVFVGATMASETTAAATGTVGVARRDPMAMLPFCGYNMADYFGHWLEMGSKMKNLPKIFHVNWFRRGSGGEFLWPGFGENVRVLKWIFDRVNGSRSATETPIGFLPTSDSLDLQGLAINKESLAELLRVDAGAWQEEVREIGQFFEQFGDRLPRSLHEERETLSARLI